MLAHPKTGNPDTGWSLNLDAYNLERKTYTYKRLFGLDICVYEIT